MKNRKFEIVAFILFIVFIGSIIYAAVIAEKQESEDRLLRYKECKTKTEDIEWCFRTIRPN